MEVIISKKNYVNLSFILLKCITYNIVTDVNKMEKKI